MTALYGVQIGTVEGKEFRPTRTAAYLFSVGITMAPTPSAPASFVGWGLLE
jgi:hypothetical protein